MKTNVVYNEDCLRTMDFMPSECIDLIVTSPPYDNLRKYKGFSFEFEKIAKELFRITAPGGVLVWVVGDAVINGSETGTSFKQALYFMECGFKLHDTMLYLKNSPAYPASAKSTRYGQVFEYMFVLSKGAPKAVNLLKDKVNKWAGASSFGRTSTRATNGELITRDKIRNIGAFGYRYNAWTYANGAGFSSKDKIAFQHPAIYPEKLAEDHILSWSNIDDMVYDPFAGSGTTLKMAKKKRSSLRRLGNFKRVL